MRDSSSGWDLGPDLDHFSSRTRQVLQFMNPNKINVDLLVDLLDYLGIIPPSHLEALYDFVENSFCDFLVFLCQTNLHSLQRWMELCSFFSQVWLTFSSSTTFSHRTRDFGRKTGIPIPLSTNFCFQTQKLVKVT